MNCVLRDIFGDDLTEFKELIETNNAVISGSFITQCAINEYWNRSDIDIFILDDRKKICDKDFEKFLCGKMGFKMKKDDPYYCKYAGISEMRNLVSYKTHPDLKYSIDIMGFHGEDDTLIKFVWDMYDFDICRNTYYIDNKEILNICAINDICTKTTKFQIGSSLWSAMYQYHKYIDRGFHIIRNNMSYEDFVKLSYTFEQHRGIEYYKWHEYELFKIKQIGQTYMEDGFNEYKLIEGDMDKLSQARSWGSSIILNNGVLNIFYHVDSIDNHDYGYNGKYCPLIFCGSSTRHFHFEGPYFGDDVESNFICVIVD